MPKPRLKVARPDRVYERLRDLIIRGRVAPGARVVEADLATRLGVSRTPAREAIHRLFQEGFLMPTGTLRRTELLVAPLTADDMWDLYLLMSSLEGSAALAIGELDASGVRDLVRDLKKLEEDFELAARQRDVDYDRVFEAHNQFHARIVGAARRPRLQAMINTVRPQVDRYEWVYAPMVGPDFSATFDEHAAILRAIRTGSGKKAQQAVAANWERGAARLARVIGKAGSRGNW